MLTCYQCITNHVIQKQALISTVSVGPFGGWLIQAGLDWVASWNGSALCASHLSSEQVSLDMYRKEIGNMQGLLKPRLGTDTFTFASLCWSRQVTMLSPMSRSKEICSTSMGCSGCGVPPDPCSEPRHSFPQLLGILLASIQNISEGPSQLQSFTWDWLRPWLQLS